MSGNEFMALLGAGILASGIAWELWRSPMRKGSGLYYARSLGHLNAAQDMSRDDYPMDYSDAERDAWRAGWDEYHERQ